MDVVRAVSMTQCFFFFFQAEDGIRDYKVTGVQTCALPICPEAKRPGYDLVIQGEAGLMALNGEAGTPPLKFGVAVVDLMTGMYAAQAILAALFRRERTGKGRLIEMALYDSGIMITGYYGLDAMQLGHDPERYGNAHPSIVPYGMYEAADGPLIIAVGNNAQFDKFCRQVVMRPDIVEDARFSTNVNRAKNRLELGPMLKELIRSFPRDLLLERLTAAGIPCGRVAGLHEALTDRKSTRLNSSHLVISYAVFCLKKKKTASVRALDS